VQTAVRAAALARTNPSFISWETCAISRTGGDIQATTKVVDFRSLKSSPPIFLETSILESGVLEGSAFLKCRVFPSDPEITVTVVTRTR
jgi:hypothetical protein